MVLVPGHGMEKELIIFIKDKTTAVDEHYTDKIEQLTPGTHMKYYKQHRQYFQ